jgi:hypothetical protein
MIKRGALMALIAALQFAEKAQAEEKEPAAVVEIGGAGEWSLGNGGSSFGPAAAVEFTPLKNWLEIEAGSAPLFSGGHTEWDTESSVQKAFHAVEYRRVHDRRGTAMDLRGWRCGKSWR